MHTEQVKSSARNVRDDAPAYESQAERLTHEAQTAITAAGGHLELAAQILLNCARNDVDLLWEMVADYRQHAAWDTILKTERAGQGFPESQSCGATTSSPLSRAGRAVHTSPPVGRMPTGTAPSPSSEDVAYQTSDEAAGHYSSDSQNASATPASLDPNEKAPGAGQQGSATHHDPAARAPSLLPLAPNEKAPGAGQQKAATHQEPAAQAPSPDVHVRAHQRCAPGHASRGIDAVEGMNRSLLRTFLVNGTPIADVTAAEARAWGTAQQRRGRFAILMADGVPDNMLIGSCKTDADAIIAAHLSENENV